jgi:osmotically-inducible protein OsmY
MNSLRSAKVASAALAVVCSIAPLLCAAQMSQQTPPDNSKVNANHQKTADNQTNESADRMITAKARKAVMADKTLSTYAHNIKIITMNGKVTLKGPVQSDEEKQRIVSDLAEIVPADSLTNQLTVKQ